MQPRRIHLGLAFGVLAVFAAAALQLHWHKPQPLGQSFDGELGNIAEALARGRGFSNPFVDQTGPTGWAPPGYCFFLAGIFLLAGVKTVAAAWTVIVLEVCALAAGTWLVLETAAVTWLHRSLIVVLIVTGVLLHRGAYLSTASDASFLFLLTGAALYALMRHRRARSRRTWTMLIGLSVVLPLTHAGLAAGFLAAAGGLAWADFRASKVTPGPKRLKQAAATPAVLVLISFFAVGLWSVRYYRLFGAFIPVKSNGWFELYLTEACSPDGLPRLRSLYLHHPFYSQPEFDRYAKLGEWRFMRYYRDVVRQHVTAGRFLRHVLNRAESALVFPAEPDDAALTHVSLPPGDVARLTQAKLLLPVNGVPVALWLCLDTPPTEFFRQLQALHLAEPDRAAQDWVNLHLHMLAERSSFRYLAAGFLLSGVPAACFLGLLLLRRRLAEPVLAAAWFYFGALAPFILVSHEARHQYPYLGLQAMLIAAFALALRQGWRAWRSPIS